MTERRSVGKSRRSGGGNLTPARTATPSPSRPALLDPRSGERWPHRSPGSDRAWNRPGYGSGCGCGEERGRRGSCRDEGTRSLRIKPASRVVRNWVLVVLALGLGAAFAHPTDAEARTHHHRRAPRARFVAPALIVPDSARDTTRTALETEIDRIVKEAGGTMGVSIVHLESGERIVRNGDQRYPMASVFKVPIALRLLHRVDQGEISLGDTVQVRTSDLRTGSGRIAARHPRGGRMTLLELFDGMLTESDNTASDFLLRVAGGPGAVTARIRDLGVRDVRVDRSEVQMAFDYYGVTDAPPDSLWNPTVLAKLMNGSPYVIRKQTATAFLEDPRDTATPTGMTDLLQRLWAGQALSAANTALLIDTMEHCRTGPGRLPALLPAGTRVAHKTGTWSSTDGVTAALNDVGIISLPGDGGHLAIAVLVKGSRRSNGRMERCIAHTARAAWDRWAPLQSELASLPVPAALPVTTAADAADATGATDAKKSAGEETIGAPEAPVLEESAPVPPDPQSSIHP